MEREIAEQPHALSRTLEANAAEIQALGRALRSRTISTVMIAARGSSDNAGVYANYLFQAFNRVPVAMATPSLYTFHHTAPAERHFRARRLAVRPVGGHRGGHGGSSRQGALTASITADDRSPWPRSPCTS